MFPIEYRETVPPVNDTGDLLEHTTGIWGRFQIGERGYIGGVHPNEIRGIALEWVNTCTRAIRGQHIVRRTIEEGVVSGDLESVQALITLTRSLGKDIPYADRLLIIEKAKIAFQYLYDPNSQPTITQEDVDAAELLVSGLDHLYRPRHIRPPSK